MVLCPESLHDGARVLSALQGCYLEDNTIQSAHKLSPLYSRQNSLHLLLLTYKTDSVYQATDTCEL